MSWYLVLLLSCLDFLMLRFESSLKESRYAELEALANGEMLRHINLEGRFSWEWMDLVYFIRFFMLLEFDWTMFSRYELNSLIFWKKSTLLPGKIDPS